MSAVPSLRSSNLGKQVPYALVLVITALGITYSSVDSRHWLRGVGVVGVALLLAGGFRLLLSTEQAGLLVVRRRAFDATCYLSLGAAVIGVGLLLPR